MKTSKLTFNDVLESGLSTLIVMKAEDLQQTIYDAVDATRRKLEDEVINLKSEKFLTINQVVEILSISRTTLWHWIKKGYIIPTEVGGKKRFKQSDIYAFLKQRDQLDYLSNVTEQIG